MSPLRGSEDIIASVSIQIPIPYGDSRVEQLEISPSANTRVIEC